MPSAIIRFAGFFVSCLFCGKEKEVQNMGCSGSCGTCQFHEMEEQAKKKSKTESK